MYKFNKETLLWEKNNELYSIHLLLKILTISLFMLCIFMFISFNTIQNNTNKIIENKNKEIANLKDITYNLQNPKKDSISEYKEFRKSLPLKLNSKEEKRLTFLYFKYKKVISENHCPANFVWYIAYRESNFGVREANSKSSAKGMFQFVKGTWDSMCKRNGLNANEGRYDEGKQVKVMCLYLNYLYKRYGNWEKAHREYCGGEPPYKLPYYK